MVGLVTALGADAPEIASAVIGIMGGHNDLGLGVIFGSNIFNLAALLGIGAIVAGRIRVGRPGILLNGAVAFWITGVSAAQAVGLLAPFLSIILAVTALLPYIAVLAREPGRILDLPAPAVVRQWLCRATGGARQDSQTAELPREPTNIDLLALVPLLVMVVLASVGLVHSALVLGEALGISKTVIGTLVLAPLTGQHQPRRRRLAARHHRWPRQRIRPVSIVALVDDRNDGRGDRVERVSPRPEVVWRCRANCSLSRVYLCHCAGLNQFGQRNFGLEPKSHSGASQSGYHHQP